MLGQKTQLAGFVLKTEWSEYSPRGKTQENPSHLWPRSPAEGGWVDEGNSGSPAGPGSEPLGLFLPLSASHPSVAQKQMVVLAL